MFTGLIEDLGTVREFRQGAESIRLTVATGIPMSELQLGESIAVNGICLTVVSFGGGVFSADVSPETLDRTSLGGLAPGARVNLERALRLSDRLGGHLVSGHVDALATITERRRDANAIRFTFALPEAVDRYLVEKGSVAIDGISLTVNAVSDQTFSVAVIPHTLEMTTLKEKSVGARVNIEVDIIGKYVERLMGGREQGPEKRPLSLDFLAKHGFL
ncbi:riboflavin synthase [Desulfuromonas sp. TF]|uniref:riboflavin synthase n=1 Tax=Desulfuromonas sp. TF TaxID=1232410 RepID=UPI00042A6C8F|nr:riboflavin synthase [Desulfuromonas sp. TF]